MTATLGYIALGIMAAIAAGMFIAACCAVAMWVRFGRETDAVRRELWKHTLLGDEGRGS